MFNPEYGMPYQTDVNQYETEEERRRRLAQEAEANMPVKQTITYDPKTGAQKVRIEGGASNLTSANSATPTVAGPVSPDDTYQRMIQAESGGRQFNAQGGVLTSPKGAMGVGQVMPSTAMQPGYGVSNIFDMAQQRGMPVAQRDEATAKQLLGNEQLNRDFGQSYFNAMQQQFPQDPAASVAAYNAGPGRVGQNMQANAGQLNRGQLPQETQAYIQSVLDRQGQPGTAPQAQAQQQPQPIINDQGQTIGQETPGQMVAGAATNAPVAQAPAPATGAVSPEMMQTSMPAGAPEQMGPSTALMTPAGWVERFETAKNDFGSLSSMLADPNLPPGGRMEIAATMADQMRFQKQETEAKEKTLKALETGNLRELERQDKKMGGEGSWLRYIMYGLLGSPNAQLEKDKLFPEMSATTQTFDMGNGKTGYIRMGKDGTPLRGATDDGRQLTQKELIKYARGIGGEIDIVGGTFVSDTLKDKNGNPLVGSVIRDKKTGKGYVETDEGRKPLAGFRPQSSSGSLTDMRARQIQTLNIALQGKTEEEKMAIMRPYNQQLEAAGFPAISPQEVGITAPQIGAPQAQVQPAPQAQPAPMATPQAQSTPMATPQAQPAAGPVAPGAMPPAAPPQVQPPPQPAPAAVARPTGTQLAAAEEAAKTEARATAEDIAKIKTNLPKVTSQADSAIRTVDDILSHAGFSEVVGFPDILTGIVSPPGTNARGAKAKFRQLEGQIFTQAFESIKGGGAITEKEGEKATVALAALMDPGIKQVEWERNAEIFKNSIKKMVNRQRETAGLPRLEKYEPGTAQDRAAVNWLQANPDSPKAEAIRKQLEIKGVL
jgi:hypothetical protein